MAFNKEIRGRLQTVGLCTKCGDQLTLGRYYCPRCTVTQAQAAKRYRKNQRLKVIDAYGGRCQVCGIDDLDVLQLDHVHNDGARDRQKTPYYAMLNNIIAKQFPDSYQILCANCNWKKRFLGGETPRGVSWGPLDFRGRGA